MKKVLFTGAGIFIVIFVLGYLYVTNTYHGTYEEALQELKQTEEGDFIQLPDQSMLIINEEGMISFAAVRYDHLFQWYGDFTVIPTSLNVFTSVTEEVTPYINMGSSYETTIGLIKNGSVEYVGFNGGYEEGYPFNPEDINEIIHLNDYMNTKRAEGVKIWFVFAGVVPAQTSNVRFFDKDKEDLSLEDKLFQEK
ncbi:hypothetical protein AUO94_07235 [Planococcus kocurii]|uniref:Uncharacterized protein n=1 Tax=Planococcus kocurii TaxID=1374 RepID=A0ABN4JVW4_9BACL|nr:hypothetical protein [Planococcus kocurii]ALS78467.1 hypothetical protein AUO94_07235 [Planococcus kocurii]